MILLWNIITKIQLLQLAKIEMMLVAKDWYSNNRADLLEKYIGMLEMW